jgi:membrane protein DedA with SNARE-associated domain
VDIAALIHSYGYAAVALGAFLEGESVLLLGAAAAARGQLSLPAVIAVAALASFLGDQLFFQVGRRYGNALLARFPTLRPRAERVRELLQRHHLPLILSIRFLYGLRIAGPVAIGMSRVPWPRFMGLNFAGAACWALSIAGLGYGMGRVLGRLLAGVDADELWGAALLAALLAGAWWLTARRGSAPAKAAGRPRR